MLGDLDCDYLATLDQHRQVGVWPEVYTLIAEGTGRLLRISPSRLGSVSGPSLIARLGRYLVDAYDEWSRHLTDDRSALIDLGRARNRRSRGATKYSAFTRPEVARLLQQQLGSGGGPRVQRARPRRGRS